MLFKLFFVNIFCAATCMRHKKTQLKNDCSVAADFLYKPKY